MNQKLLNSRSVLIIYQKDQIVEVVKKLKKYRTSHFIRSVIIDLFYYLVILYVNKTTKNNVNFQTL